MDKLVQKFSRAERLQDVWNTNRRHRDGFLGYRCDEDACLAIKARLPAGHGALVVKALEKALDEDLADRGVKKVPALTH